MTHDEPVRRSTTQVGKLPFAPHGQVDIWAEGDLHLYEATGPFNKELVDSLALAQSHFLQALQPAAPWVSICIVRTSALSTPDGLQRYADLIRQTPPRYMPAATAFVIGPGVEGGQLMASRSARIFEEAGRPFQTFATLELARDWARTLLDRGNP